MECNRQDWRDRAHWKDQEKYWRGVLEKHGPLGCALRMLFILLGTFLWGYVLIVFIAALARGCSQ